MNCKECDSEITPTLLARDVGVVGVEDLRKECFSQGLFLPPSYRSIYKGKRVFKKYVYECECGWNNIEDKK